MTSFIPHLLRPAPTPFPNHRVTRTSTTPLAQTSSPSVSPLPNRTTARPPQPPTPQRTPRRRHRSRKSTTQPPCSNIDLTLLHRARTAHKLSAARSTLRRRTGVEPLLHDTLQFAASSDRSISTNPPDWHPVFEARNQITVKWLWLVSAIAHKLYRTYSESFPEMRAAISPADLVQEGVCGLINAVERWDSTRAYPFDAFAFYTVKHAIIRALQNQSRPIRLPVHVLDKLAKMRKVRHKLELADRNVSVDIIARCAGVSRKAAELYLARSKSTMSIDAPLSANSTSTTSSDKTAEPPLRDFLVDHSVDVARDVERSCTREAVAQLVNSTDLLELERSVLFLKYGLGDGVERVRAEVSRILDVRVTNVRRAELSALKKLRHSMGDDISAWTELMS